MKKRIDWCKENILTVATLFLLVFIPLYPKLPLFDIVQTWVYIRLEDFLILIATGLLALEFYRKRSITRSPLRIPIFVYWAIGFISLINALVFIFPHFSGSLFPHLAVLHYLRRIEYMVVFFLAYEAYRKKSDITSFLWALGGSFCVIVLYGFGQKFLGFPAFMTMNEEFSKGAPLRLPPTARFPSTFAGHYDLAAYLVMTIPIMGSLIFGLRKWWLKIAFFLLTFLGLISLLFTASRVSFGVYLVAMSVMLLWQKKPLYIIPMIVLSILTLNVTSGASERFYKTFRVSDVVVDLSTGRPIGTLDKLQGTGAQLQTIESPAQETLPKGSEFINLPSNRENADGINKVTFYKSMDVTGAVGDIATISGSFLIQKALVYDISITTRLQSEWPKAIEAFKRNIFLGSGYSSLTLAADGDYHRMLGETGLLGALAFLGIFAAAFYLFFKRKDTLGQTEKALVIGLFAGIVGLLLNAVLIDVFEASKVAYTLWLLLGISSAILVRDKEMPLQYFGLLKRIATHPLAYVVYLFLAIAFVWNKVFSLYFLGDDFTWLRWMAESKQSDIIKFFTQSQGFFYRPIPKLWYYMLFSVFWLKPFGYHLMSIVLLMITAFFVYRILMIRGVNRILAWIGAFMFAVLSSHHENVYWISGQSSMLAGFFLLAAVYVQEESLRFFKRVPVFIIATTSIVFTFLAMLSYDGMVVAPVIVLLIVLSRDRHVKWPWFVLLLIPLYEWMRYSAGALAPQGDYGYKISTVLVNSVTNTVGYFVSSFGGSKIVEYWNAMRGLLRLYIKEVTVGVCVLGVITLWIFRRTREVYKKYTGVFVWLAAFLVSLIAYAPLGGMADRYTYIPSIFLMIGFVITIAKAWELSDKKLWNALILVGLSGLVFWNITEVSRLGGDWQRASHTAEQTLQVIKKETFPPKDVKTFFFVNTPIRYGSAWIFPTGLNDAIWHMYRDSPYRVFLMPSLEDSYEYPMHAGDREVFIFENYQLKRGVRQEKVITPSEATDEK